MKRNKKLESLKTASIIQVNQGRYNWEATIFFSNGMKIDINMDNLKKYHAIKKGTKTLADLLRSEGCSWFSDKRTNHHRIKITNTADINLYRRLSEKLHNNPNVISIGREKLANGFRSPFNPGPYRIILRTKGSPSDVKI